jgi:RNA polymerase sigma-70 factor (ECF subfamily)
MEIELVRRAQRGDEEAFSALVPAAADRLLGVAYRILRDAALAEDATQQALLQAWRGLPKLRDVARFEAWTYRLVVHACYAEARRRRVWSGIRPLLAREERARDETAEVVNRDLIDRGFRQLSTQHRAVLVLYHYVGLPHSEIAALLDLPVGTVRSRLHYASRALRAAIDRDDLVVATRSAS